MVPGAVPVYLASIVGRLPNGAIGLLLILRTRELTGSYAAGGLVAGALAVTIGLGAPIFGRVVDRRGQRGVLVVSGLASAAAMAAFAALPDGTSTALAVGVAALIGLATPPLNSCIRALWSAHVAPERRHRAFAIDSVVFEIVDISGPLLFVAGIGAWSLRAALAACAVTTAVGSVAFAATRLSREWRSGPAAGDPLGALRGAGVRRLMVTFALFGVGVGAVEIALAAFATRHGSPGAVGLLLALWGAGSMAGGIAAAQSRAPADPAGRLVWLLCGLGVLDLPLALAAACPR
jgi:MFS family permease